MSISIALRSLLFLIPLACAAPSGSTSVDPGTFQQSMAAAGAQVIDVRTPAEFQSGHIAGARNLDWTGGQLEQHAGELDASKPLLLYCASGRRSAAANAFLRDRGFAHVTDLVGGMHAWEAAGLPVAR
jgi:rhodanese-related sulfurtransferase